MRLVTLLALSVLLSALPALAADKGSKAEYRKIIEKRCTACHDADRIEQAMAEGHNLNAILNKMQGMGAVLTTRDKEVMGIFWGSPLYEEK